MLSPPPAKWCRTAPPLEQLPPSTRPEVNKDDGILADPIDDQANQATVLEITKLSKPIPITPGEPLPEDIKNGLENIKDPEQRKYIEGLISGGYQISGKAKDGCNIDIKGDYETVKAQLNNMKEQFGGEITHPEMLMQPGTTFPVLTIPGEQTVTVAARPTAKSTGTPTLEVTILTRGKKAYTIKIRAN